MSTMKTRLLGSIIALSAATVLVQGTVNFANIQGSLNVPVYESDGTTKAAGSQYMAELMASSTQNGTYFSVAMTGFLTGAAAGYFSGGARTVNGIAGGATAWLQVRFWATAAGSTYAAASASGINYAASTSSPFPVVLGDPSGVPPTVPAALSGLIGQTTADAKTRNARR